MNKTQEEIVRQLEKFDSIYLKDISTSRLMNRIDTKFVFDIASLEEILQHLIEDYNVLEVSGKRISTYESLYLDGENHPFYLAHHNKHDHRFKVRYRKYVESGTTFLEVKEKRKGRTIKRRIEVGRVEHDLSESSHSFIQEYTKEGALKPVLWSTYERITLVSEAINERVTIDLDLRYMWAQETKKFANLAIAELKQERIDRNSPFYQLMKSRMIRPYQLSKYCIGIIELKGDDGIKYNRFKKKIRTIKKINNAS